MRLIIDTNLLQKPSSGGILDKGLQVSGTPEQCVQAFSGYHGNARPYGEGRSAFEYKTPLIGEDNVTSREREEGGRSYQDESIMQDLTHYKKPSLSDQFLDWSSKKPLPKFCQFCTLATRIFKIVILITID